MARVRRQVLHNAAELSVRVIYAVQTNVDGEILEKSVDTTTQSPEIIAKIKELEALIDKEFNLDGDDPRYVEMFTPTPIQD